MMFLPQTDTQGYLLLLLLLLNDGATQTRHVATTNNLPISKGEACVK